MDSDLLEIQTLVGSYRLRSDEVVAIRPERPFPFLARALGVHHSHAGMPHRIYLSGQLLGVGNLPGLIKAAGFAPRAEPSKDRWGDSMAWRSGFLIVWIASWNLLIGLDHIDDEFFREGIEALDPMPGLGTVVATGTTAAVGIAAEFIPAVQRWIVKPGRSIVEVQPTTRLTSAITLLFFLICMFIVPLH